MEQWFCGTELRSDSYLWWEAESIAARFDPWMRHRYAPAVYALLIILMLTTRVLVDVVELVFKIEVLLTVALVFAVTALAT